VELLFKESFARDLKAIKQKSVLPRIRQVLQAVANAEDLRSIPNIRKLNAPGNYYRIRVGEYRLGSVWRRIKSPSSDAWIGEIFTDTFRDHRTVRGNGTAGDKGPA